MTTSTQHRPGPETDVEPAATLHTLFWIITVQWTRTDGIRSTLTIADILDVTTDETVSRKQIFDLVMQRLIRRHGVPADAVTVHFAVEPDRIALPTGPGGA